MKEKKREKKEENPSIIRISKKLKIGKYEENMKKGQRIIIDCNFPGLMSEKEEKSLSKQLTYCYHFNKESETPSNLFFTGVNPSLYAKLLLNSAHNWKVNIKTTHYMTHFNSQDLVYLTADSHNILTEFDPLKIYIIGGVVDRNRNKRCTISRAECELIQTARLPLDQFVQIQTTKVLTMLHVFQLVLAVAGGKDWETAFIDFLPTRKHITSILPNTHTQQLVEEHKQ